MRVIEISSCVSCPYYKTISNVRGNRFVVCIKEEKVIDFYQESDFPDFCKLNGVMVWKDLLLSSTGDY